MVDAEDKTGRFRQSWATAIPLVTLLGVVFGAGVGWAQLAATRKSIDDVSVKVKEFADKSEARIRSLEEKTIERGAVDAAVAPMVSACAKVVERSKR